MVEEPDVGLLSSRAGWYEHCAAVSRGGVG